MDAGGWRCCRAGRCAGIPYRSRSTCFSPARPGRHPTGSRSRPRSRYSKFSRYGRRTQRCLSPALRLGELRVQADKAAHRAQVAAESPPLIDQAGSYGDEQKRRQDDCRDACGWVRITALNRATRVKAPFWIQILRSFFGQRFPSLPTGAPSGPISEPVAAIRRGRG